MDPIHVSVRNGGGFNHYHLVTIDENHVHLIVDEDWGMLDDDIRCRYKHDFYRYDHGWVYEKQGNNNRSKRPRVKMTNPSQSPIPPPDGWVTEVDGYTNMLYHLMEFHRLRKN